MMQQAPALLESSMSFRCTDPSRICTDLVTRYPPNWTAVIFLSVMGCLHLANAIPAFLHGRIAGSLSALLAMLLFTAAFILWRLRVELAIRPSTGELRLSARFLKTWSDRRVVFDQVQCVRVYLPSPTASRESQIEILTATGPIDCPPTAVPQQQALWMAMAMNCELVKISDSEPPPQTRQETAVPQA